MSDIDTLIADIAAQLGAARCILMVIDTLNRSLVGSESKDEDMAGYISACDRLREAFGCAVIVVHHCGVEGTRPRGHTSLSGAVDAQIAVKRDKAGNIVAAVEFMKDGPEGDEIVSHLVVIDLGTDEDGETVTSCVVEPSDGSSQICRRFPTGQAGLAFKQLQSAIAKAGEPPPDTANFPAGRLVVPIAVWRTYCQKGGLTEGDNEDTFKKAWTRVRERLLAGCGKMQEHRHSGARALPASPKSRNTDQRNQWLGQCSWFPGPALTGRPGMTREFFSILFSCSFARVQARLFIPLLRGGVC